jgi:hypothetical protein
VDPHGCTGQHAGPLGSSKPVLFGGLACLHRDLIALPKQASEPDRRQRIGKASSTACESSLVAKGRESFTRAVYKAGAGSRVRTDDLLITNQLLYQLSYAGLLKWCEKNHILAVAATLCFQNATAKIHFRILSVTISNHPSPRTKAERDLIQGGFATKPPARSVHGSLRRDHWYRRRSPIESPRKFGLISRQGWRKNRP